jgi:hypothetical protein
LSTSSPGCPEKRETAVRIIDQMSKKNTLRGLDIIQNIMPRGRKMVEGMLRISHIISHRPKKYDP